MKISCIIVDDEPLSHEVLQSYIAKYPGLELQAAFFNALDAIAFLNQNRPDLIFLDINMPELSGISMLKSLPNPPFVIFTTAYPEYAVDGFDLNITDFLLKPFSFERFATAVGKLSLHTENVRQTDEDFLIVKSGKKHYRIRMDNILFLESAGDYVKVVTEDKTYISSESMKYYEDTLPSSLFLRIHRSFIIQLSRVEFIEGNYVFLAGHELAIGRQYRPELQSRLRLDA
jgi:DNA-binding LytR/AlgR family response regulator